MKWKLNNLGMVPYVVKSQTIKQLCFYQMTFAVLAQVKNLSKCTCKKRIFFKKEGNLTRPETLYLSYDAKKKIKTDPTASQNKKHSKID